jgi:hypothetical protein
VVKPCGRDYFPLIALLRIGTAQTSDRRPRAWDPRCSPLHYTCGRRSPASACFRQNFEVALHELARTSVATKSFEVVSVCVGSDVGNSLTHVTQVQMRILIH